MAVAAPDPKPASSSTTPESFRVITRLVSRILSLQSVRRIGLAVSGLHVGLWVFLATEDDEVEGRIYLYEREYLTAVGPTPFDLHVVPLDAIDEDVLPELEIVFER